MSDKVTYHQEGGVDREFVILAKNSNGTVDIGPEGGPAVVTGVEIAESRTVGQATLIVADPEDKDSDKETDESTGGKRKSTK